MGRLGLHGGSFMYDKGLGLPRYLLVLQCLALV